ncbi:phosphopantetheine-binding protein [Streptomyces bohaiensis]|uniref:Acyl carrier protein n=1 Tax=Streptomyces bohaiensis TaxID=1431344 RepID=A0ABX1C7Z3_9ACTN|nr:phosphopantetheine-binding protein [Streptomyces bohaiensis]NJQ15276.1 acyl carrier protein [Streptomyces bohaiensis]
MSSTEIRTQVREFISGRFPQVTFDDDQDIFEMGFVNSLFAMELVVFVERTFAVRVPNNELRRENFRSVTSITGVVERVTAASTTA